MRSIVCLFLLLSLTVETGCYQLKIVPKNNEQLHNVKGPYRMWTFLWGALPDKKLEGTDFADCNGNGFSSVRVKTNFGGIILCVVTLGIVLPQQVYYDCSKDTPPCPPPCDTLTVPQN